ncbi:hypothetical protein QN277_022215 [Acacia crassicarpa]|uniref:Uncharacterized protein n=1 Tax=Acacia crassicarpa TaxID=499986 RepID=A0AAE1MLL7_9FABA|nr:hypothetical protein QN277_022215 [Acacia crassicarpa]
MKCLWSRPLAALALTLSLLLSLSTWSPTRVKSETLPPNKVNSLPLSKTSSSQAAAQRKNPSRQVVVDSSFRTIPPSKSNPTQNKQTLNTCC